MSAAEPTGAELLAELAREVRGLVDDVRKLVEAKAVAAQLPGELDGADRTGADR